MRQLSISAQYYGGPKFVLSETRSHPLTGTWTRTAEYHPTTARWDNLTKDPAVLRAAIVIIVDLLERELAKVTL